MPQTPLSEILRVERARRYLGMVEASKAIGINKETLARLEKGQGNPYYPTIKRIAEFYNLPIQDLLVASAPVDADNEEERENEAPKAAALNSSDDEVRRVLELWAPFVDTANQEEVETFTEAVVRCAQGDDRWAAETLVTMTSSASIQEMEEGRDLKRLAEPKERDRWEELEELVRRSREQLAALRARTSESMPTDLDEQLLAALRAKISEFVPTDKR